MTAPTSESSLQRYARFAGFLYLTIIVTSLLSFFAVDSAVAVLDDVALPAASTVANEWLFRSVILYELIMFASVVLLAWALYVVLATVDRNLALLGLLWRIAEAVVGIVVVLAGLLVLLLLNSQTSFGAGEGGQLRVMVDTTLQMRAPGFSVVTFFLCLGTIVNCYLLYVSRYVPRALSDSESSPAHSC